MDGENIAYLAGGALALKIIDKVFEFVKGQKPTFNGQTTLITRILEQQTEILKDIRHANQENGKRLEIIGTSLTVAMERQQATGKLISDIHNRQ